MQIIGKYYKTISVMLKLNQASRIKCKELKKYTFIISTLHNV